MAIDLDNALLRLKRKAKPKVDACADAMERAETMGQMAQARARYVELEANELNSIGVLERLIARRKGNPEAANVREVACTHGAR